MPVLFRGPSTALIPDLMNDVCMIKLMSAGITDGGDSDNDFTNRGGQVMPVVRGSHGFLG